VTDGEGTVGVGDALLLGWHELMPWHSAHCGHDALVERGLAGLDGGLSRQRRNLRHHLPALGGKFVLGARRQHGAGREEHQEQTPGAQSAGQPMPILRLAAYMRSIIAAIPCPPPMHMVMSP